MRINDNDIAVMQEVGDYPLLAFKEARPAFLIPVATCVRYSQQLALIPLADQIQPSLHGAQNESPVWDLTVPGWVSRLQTITPVRSVADFARACWARLPFLQAVQLCALLRKSLF